MSIWTSAITFLGNVVSGFFGFKGKQAETVSKALDIVGDVNSSDDARAVAAAQIIASEARSESWLTRTWRPMIVVGFSGILFGYFFGYVPENVDSVIINRVFDLVEYSVLGYMGMRSADKWIRDLSLGSVLREFVKKRLS